jgi:hypothetical protein
VPPPRPEVRPTLDDATLAELLEELEDGPGPARPRSEAPSTLPRQRATEQAVPHPDRPERAAEPHVPGADALASGTDRPDAGRAWDEETFGPEEDPTVPSQSADGPVLRSRRYGDFRPPVPIGRAAARAELDPPEATSLTGLGLTRRSWGRTGSLLFRLFFVAVYLLILAELVGGILTSAASP